MCRQGIEEYKKGLADAEKQEQELCQKFFTLKEELEQAKIKRDAKKIIELDQAVAQQDSWVSKGEATINSYRRLIHDEELTCEQIKQEAEAKRQKILYLQNQIENFQKETEGKIHATKMEISRLEEEIKEWVGGGNKNGSKV